MGGGGFHRVFMLCNFNEGIADTRKTYRHILFGKPINLSRFTSAFMQRTVKDLAW